MREEFIWTYTMLHLLSYISKLVPRCQSGALQQVINLIPFQFLLNVFNNGVSVLGGIAEKLLKVVLLGLSVLLVVLRLLKLKLSFFGFF
jgi:hypothetical protein